MSDLVERLSAALSDRYVIERELGRGGMAVVFLAHDQKLNRQVALKVLRPELAASLGAGRFLREIEIAAKLTHPNILALHDCGGGDECLYYTMPFVEGESLRDRLNREKQLSIEDALQITREVADALGHAHSLGIVHRDIKPENILFTGGHVVVSDFGIASAVTAAGGEELEETELVGMPAYVSPEQASGEKDVDARSDLYSLGCVLYEMLSGDAPYTASTPQAVLAMKQSEPIPRISVVRETVPPGVEATITKMVAKNPADRFITAQQLIEALTTATDGVALAERVADGRKRTVSRWAIGFVMVGAIVVVGTVLLEPWRSGVSAAGDDIDRLVVAPLENRTGDPAAADWGFLAAQYITRAVDRASVVTVVPASRVRDLLQDADSAPGIPLGELSRRTGARYAVAGSYSGSTDRLRFDVELVDAESGELLRALEPIAGPMDSLETVLTTLARRLTAVTVSLLSPDVDPALAREWSGPPSLELVRGLVTVQDLFCKTRYPAAIAQAQRWLDQTPDFAPLLVMVAISYLNLGRDSEADSVLDLLEPLSEHLTTVERLMAEMTRAFLHGGPADGSRAIEQLYRIQPGSFGFHAGWNALRMNRFSDALERFLANDGDTPCYRYWWPWWVETSATYYLLERYEEALDVARAGLERFPAERPLLYFEALALAGLGQLAAVDSLLDLMADLPPLPRAFDTYNPGSQAALIALELEALGQHQASQQVMDRAVTWFAAQPTSELQFERAKVLYWAERWSDADTLFAALSEDRPDDLQFRGYRGVALVHLGRRDEALEIDRWLEQLDRPFLRGAHTRWRAAIAAALGDRQGAMRLLQQAYAEGMVLGYHQRRDPEWRALHDYRPYQEFVRPKG